MAIIPPPTPSEHKILHFKSIGDNLTEEEYNGIVSLLRHFNKHTETFRINETVTGEYGDYLFDLEDVTFLDNGILVSEDTILAEPKVKLTNADFKNSKYILQLKVLHYSDVNILEDMSITDYKVIETIEVELTEDVWVDIPLTGLEEDYIILYDCNILISHDNTIVTGVWVDDVDLTVDETTVDVGDTITLTATVTDNHGDSVSGVTVTFKNGATTLGTASTNSSGVATYNYTTTATGVLSLTATANSLVSDVVEVTVEGVVPSSISLISDKDILSYADGQSATLTATVVGDDDEPFEGATVTFKAYKGSTLVEDIGSDTTDSSGVASVSYSSKGAGDLSIRAECMNVSGTVSIEDIYYYGDYDKIKSNWTKNTAFSGRDIYSPTFSDLTDDVEVELKFKNTVPNNFVMGFGATSSPYTMKATFLKIVNYNSFSAYYATSSQDNQHTDISTTLTTNTVMKLVTENLHTVKWYVDDVLKVTQNTRTSLPLHLRLDDFTSTPLNLDYIKVRKI